MKRLLFVPATAMIALAGCKTTDIVGAYGEGSTALGNIVGAVATTVAQNASGENAGLIETGALFVAADTIYRNRLTAEEVERARENHEKIARSGKLYTERDDIAASRYLNRVVRRVAAQRPPGSVDLKAYIVKDDAVNAFTTGAGYLYFNRGLLAALENEAQLAMIVGHEAAHVDADHIAEGASTRAKVAVLSRLGSQMLDSAGIGGIGGSVGQLGVGLANKGVASYFSRDHESEADDIGLRYAMAAGYDGRQAARAFRVLTLNNGSAGGVAAIFASHPSSEARLRRIAAQAETASRERGFVGDEPYGRMMSTLSLASAQDLRKSGDFSAAERILRQRTGYGEQDASFYLEQGRVLMRRNSGGMANLNEAITLFQDAARLDGSDPEIARELGLAYFERGGPDDRALARQELSRYLQLARNPRDGAQIRSIVDTL